MVLNNFTKPIDIITDKDFDLVYSPVIRALSSRHWTSIKIVKKAVNFLCYKENTKILDVGSGVGKITLYKGKDIMKRNIDSEIAVDELITLLKESDAWVEPVATV